MFASRIIASSVTPWTTRWLNTAAQDLLGFFAGNVERVVAVHQHFRLDHRHETRLPGKRGVARQRMGVGLDAGAAREAVADRDHRAPLGEPRAHWK